eukprot:CAMPEP_0172551694 /NCGR_PEP_ID=MMETSP1067-20121228/40147_1 /TAXON_ID=265564 ORGANISM="Thalassiosira punctigera, Strain Tpunct2005C2" /NCGR_SAMPLE_ID=MMETSP1067 /ASSEMBLY_ACC=CAM_ASM_000444 /LENGTH=206 /DNA_ID=CAMNT_0013339505 /DNA_START=188 /DNA_END=807 /DNA_ORIENTATION=+
MARTDFPDDGTSAGGDNDTYTYDDTITEMSRSKKANPILKRLFASCEDDALGSVHRAWAVTVIFMVMFFVVSIIEATKLQEAGSNASFALEIAAYWSAAPTSYPCDHWDLHPQTVFDGIHGGLLPGGGGRRFATESAAIRVILPLPARKRHVQSHLRGFGPGVVHGTDVLLFDIGTFPASHYCEVTGHSTSEGEARGRERHIDVTQ